KVLKLCKATDAFNFYTSGQAKIQQGQLRAGYDLVLEALNSLNNVYGALHPEIAQCLRLLARLAYILGDHQEAMSQQHKAVLMSERCNGTHLALYCFANWQVSTALKLLYRARYLLLLSNGENHPHMALLDCNIGLILHAVNEYDLSLKFLDNALKLHVQYFGRQSLKTALTYHLLARTQSCRGDFRSALQYEKETFTIYKNTYTVGLQFTKIRFTLLSFLWIYNFEFNFGEDHEKTRESGECLRHLTQQAVTFQKRMNEITTRKQQQYSSVSQLLPLQTNRSIQQPSLNSVLEMLNIVNGIVFIQISQKEVEALKAEIEEENKQQQQQQDNSRLIQYIKIHHSTM
uniref:Uncharacterized protein n=1 Tax=Romanomermis culicivorax TaxID=13658 RepID=A0A915J4Z3_ROMCU